MSLHRRLLRVASELPQGDTTRRKLLKVLKESSTTQDYNLGDDLPEDHLPRGWFKVLNKVRDAAVQAQGAIAQYGEVMQEISSMDVPPEVKKLARRGMDTARSRGDSWNAISDDPFVMNRAFGDAIKKGWEPRHMR